MKATLNLLAAAGTIVLAAPSIAEACYGCFDGQDAKTSPGISCVVDRGDSGHNWNYTNLGQVCNFDTNDSIRVHCPLQKDVLGSVRGLSCATATLVRYGGSTGCNLVERESWECIVQSKNESGIVGWWSGWLPLEFDLDAGTLAAFGYMSQDWAYSLQSSYGGSSNYLDHGVYYLSCDLPPVGNCQGQTCLGSLKWIEK